MRYLLVSDIHSNREALEAVTEDAAGKYDRVLCLGDVVGYGADPNAVTAWARHHADITIRGNHDRACVGLEDLEWFNPVAKEAALWTMQALTGENTAWLRELPKGPRAVDDFHIVHGSPLDEDEYMVTTDDAVQSFAYVESPLIFFGHTHVQGGFMWRNADIERIDPMPLQASEMRLQLAPDAIYFINPGSVGQPRDADPRAAYALYFPEESCVIYRRLKYDVAGAQASIRRAGLPGVLADRLTWGR